jgi:hypothetical protein
MPRVGRTGWSKFWFRLGRWLLGRDNCELCDGRNGERGNENHIGSLTVCDYCHYEIVKGERVI